MYLDRKTTEWDSEGIFRFEIDALSNCSHFNFAEVASSKGSETLALDPLWRGF